MTISSSLNASVAGLTTTASQLATISDNIANSSTYGYKQAATDFNSMVTSSGASIYTAGGVTASVSRVISQSGAPLGPQQPFEVVAMSFRGHVLAVDHGHQPDGVEHGEIEVEVAGDLSGHRQCPLRVGRPVDADDHRTRAEDVGRRVGVGHHQ